jgi:serine/threonine-protein kinase ULK/ATG1
VIGSGSFSTVYRAQHLPSRETVAVKAVARKKLNTKLMHSLESEISILRDRQHPNIVALREIVKTADFIYLVLEFCNGGDLHGLIRERGRIAEEDTRELMTQLACGIHCLWFFKLIHRDLKPHNLLLTTAAAAATADDAGQLVIPTLKQQFDTHRLSCTLKIADFGFAR